MMLSSALLGLLFCFVVSPAQAIDWSQPQVGCPEELIPQKPDRDCLDLSQVADPMKDWPQLPPAELAYWKNTKRSILYCRAAEVENRERRHRGSQTADALETSWMLLLAAQDYDAKVAALYNASRAFGIPVQVLVGELYQESLLAELGVAADGGNYSCGIGQSNLVEWCEWANTLTRQKQNEVGWSGVDCNQLTPDLVKPFYDLALTRLRGEPEYKLQPEHFEDIEFEDVVGGFPPASEDIQQRRFEAVTSFVTNCSNANYSIYANAASVARVYRSFVPAGLKSIENYPLGSGFQRNCQQKAAEGVYPLNSGWLLAVGIFNAGTRAVDALAYYNRWSPADLKQSSTFASFQPTDLIEAFYGAGVYNSMDDRIHFDLLSGKDTNWIWFKACVLQRHIARVIQNATLPGVTLASSLDAPYGCSKSVFDPLTGQLVKTSVPPARQISSGRKLTN